MENKEENNPENIKIKRKILKIKMNKNDKKKLKDTPKAIYQREYMKKRRDIIRWKKKIKELNE